MAGGIDKLELLTKCVRKRFRVLARKKGSWRKGYLHVIDLRNTHHKLPVILHCDGCYNGIHKIEFVGVARLGLQQTQNILKMIVYRVSAVRIYRIDVCTDLLGIWVWDLAERVLVSRAQNYQIINNRGGTSFYLQKSVHKTILLYDKIKQYAAVRDPMVKLFRPSDHLTRIEVQLKGHGVPFRRIDDLHRYLEVDFLEQMQFRDLRALQDDAKPLHRLAVPQLRRRIETFGLHPTKKSFSPSQWAYLEKTLFRTLKGKEIPDLQFRLKRSIEDWLENRIRFPRFQDFRREENEVE
jgi:hypothetical protein